MTSRSNSSSRNVALITGAAEFSGVVSDLVVELLRGNGEQVRAMVRLRDEARAKRLRQLGAEVVVGDLSSPANVVDAMRDVTRMFFNTHITLDYLQETAIVCAAARELGGLKVIVKMSQMTVSQMTLTSSEESRQHRLLWLSEQIMNWSGIPVVHVRPTVLLDNPLFTVLARRSVRDRDVLALPFGTGRTSPIAAEDVARVVAALLLNPPKAGQVYELTGPQALDIKGLAEQYSRALGRTISAEDIPYDDWVHQYLRNSGLSDLVQQHLATVARLHRENRYDRSTHDVEQLTGQPPADHRAVRRLAPGPVCLNPPLLGLSPQLPTLATPAEVAEYLHTTTAALVESLRRGSDTDMQEAEAAIERLAAVPTDPGSWLYATSGCCGCGLSWRGLTAMTRPMQASAIATATWRKRLASRDILRGPRRCHDGGCPFGGGDVFVHRC